MKEWFPHDFYATRDLAIVRLVMKHGSSGYGVFWLTIELLHSNINVTHNELCDAIRHTFSDLNNAKETNAVESIVQTMIDLGLLKLDPSIINTNDEVTIYSERVLRNKQQREAIADTKRSAAEKRWKQKRTDNKNDHQQSMSIADAMPIQDKTEQNRTEQISKDVISLGTEVTLDSPIMISFTCIAGRMFHVKQSEIDEMSSIYPNVDIFGELRKMLVWITVNPTKRKTTRGMPRFIHNWLGKAQDHGQRPISNQSTSIKSGKIGERKSEFTTSEYDEQIRSISEQAIERLKTVRDSTDIGTSDQEHQITSSLRQIGETD